MFSETSLTESVTEHEEWRWVFISSAILLLIVMLPFAWAFFLAGPQREFVGVLVTPLDGATYLAKMNQGFAGNWLFQLVYTPETHGGVLLFTYYLALGNLARVLGLEPVLVFHVMRLLGAMLMFLAIYRFVANWSDDIAQRRLMWALAVLAAGFGWIAVLFGAPTPDVLLLPEAFPLQAAYANAHFPWAIAAGTWMAHTFVTVFFIERDKWPEFGPEAAGLAVVSVFLVTTSPFMLGPLAFACAVYVVWLWRRTGHIPRRELAWGAVVGIFTLPFVAYNVWAVSGANPVIQAWMTQNSTPSPPLWEYAIAFGPLLILGGIGIWASRRSLRSDDLFLLAWLVGTLLLLYAPLNLQRRFAMGITIPLAIYAARGLRRVLMMNVRESLRPVVLVAAFAAFMPTVIMAVALPMVGTLSAEGEEVYFLTDEEVEALSFVSERGGLETVVLAPPELSLFVPTRNLRVVYGHPFETVNADQRREKVEAYFTGEDCSVVAEEPINYVVVTNRTDLPAAQSPCLPDSPPVFTSTEGRVVVYALDQ